MEQPVANSKKIGLFDALTSYDLHLLVEGTHYRSFEKLGAHLVTRDGRPGVRFAVWCPNASAVSVVGPFNSWNDQHHQLRPLDSSGIWETFVPDLNIGELYKFVIYSAFDGSRLEKADPYAFFSEVSPGTASRVWELDTYEWRDSKWRDRLRGVSSLEEPLSIYELHLGSWMRVPEENNRPLTYRDLAEKLPPYIHELGFTHVELLPVMEHPFGGSWGYQPLSYYAPTSRYGTPTDFMYFIDTLHQNGIGVILDWVPAHFPGDPHGLSCFDGTCLYEHADPRRGHHPDWNTKIFNYGRNEVRNFLISNALFWIEKYHVDGLRVDAVASMLYLDYSRREGEWIPNHYGGRENTEAIHFLKTLNEVVYGEHQEVLMIAEESTAWPMVSRPTYLGGLGFGYKWNMGWMNDVLHYFAKEPIHRQYHHSNLTFGMLYAFHENFLLPFSHDEVVHGKGSLYQKMPGDDWQKFANLRLLYSFMFAHPGKKLLFMGSEFGQIAEWNCDTSLDWHLLDSSSHNSHQHRALKRLVGDLNRIYRNFPALYQLDFDPQGFCWIDCNDQQQSVVSFLRQDRNDPAQTTSRRMLCIFNFTPVPRFNYRVGVPIKGFWEEIHNSDAEYYSGTGLGNLGGVSSEEVATHGYPQSISITLPPLAALFLAAPMPKPEIL